jgi:hypothetical protein
MDTRKIPARAFPHDSATWREIQIRIGVICSELFFVRNHDYFTYADPGITSGLPVILPMGLLASRGK